jgi:hypothetical protein
MTSAPGGMIGVMPVKLSFAEKPTITGKRVLLRPVDPADGAGLAAIDDEALQLTGTQRKANLKNCGTGTPPGPITPTGWTCPSSTGRPASGQVRSC